LVSERRAFGERLRRQRERQHVTLESIAASTKVAAALFAGLERGDCSRWPGGMYNRSFIRAYAAAVQLNPDDTAAEFVEYYETPVPPAPPAPAAARTAISRVGGSALRLSLELDPVERRRRTARVAGLALLDVAIVVAVAGLVALSAGSHIWLTLAVTSLSYQVLARLVPAMTTTDRLTGPADGTASEPGGQEAEDVPVGGTASTIA
jgi:transcriptional regulator with XRE-family HTH domain